MKSFFAAAASIAASFILASAAYASPFEALDTLDPIFEEFSAAAQQSGQTCQVTVPGSTCGCSASGSGASCSCTGSGSRASCTCKDSTGTMFCSIVRNACTCVSRAATPSTPGTPRTIGDSDIR